MGNSTGRRMTEMIDDVAWWYRPMGQLKGFTMRWNGNPATLRGFLHKTAIAFASAPCPGPTCLGSPRAINPVPKSCVGIRGLALSEERPDGNVCFNSAAPPFARVMRLAQSLGVMRTATPGHAAYRRNWAQPLLYRFPREWITIVKEASIMWFTQVFAILHTQASRYGADWWHALLPQKPDERCAATNSGGWLSGATLAAHKSIAYTAPCCAPLA